MPGCSWDCLLSHITPSLVVEGQSSNVYPLYLIWILHSRGILTSEWQVTASVWKSCVSSNFFSCALIVTTPSHLLYKFVKNTTRKWGDYNVKKNTANLIFRDNYQSIMIYVFLLKQYIKHKYSSVTLVHEFLYSSTVWFKGAEVPSDVAVAMVTTAIQFLFSIM